MTRAAQKAEVALLTLDIGNSGMRAAWWVGRRVLETWRCSYDDSTSTWWRAWRRYLATSGRTFGTGAHVEVASVAPRRRTVVLRALEDQGFRAVHVVTSQDRWPFRFEVEAPETVGVDRLANVAGAIGLGMKRAVIVDLGTAITLDVLADGAFRGGLIAPGMTLQARALHEHTAVLPLVDMTTAAPRVGRSTREAILAGIQALTLRGTAWTARRLARDLGPGTAIVLTGGYAARLRRHLRGARLEPLLLLRGLWERARGG